MMKNELPLGKRLFVQKWELYIRFLHCFMVFEDCVPDVMEGSKNQWKPGNWPPSPPKIAPTNMQELLNCGLCLVVTV